jgi:glycosyltransferase involved in cell wall biosynthesis
MAGEVPRQDRGGAGAPARRLGWSHCIATLDRIDVLDRAVALSLAQTRPPAEIVIVDASTAAAAHEARIAARVAAAPEPRPRLVYRRHPVRSLTQQRNAAVAAATGDVLFLFDDDTLMHPGCAAAILAVYEADAGARIAAVAAVPVAEVPADGGPPLPPRKPAGHRGRGPAGALARWLWRELFLMDAERHFIAYDRPRRRGSPAEVAALGIPGIAHQPLIPGFSITVRRRVAAAEPFDATLLAYCPAEDLDATYRFSRHGLNVAAADAAIHHAEVAASRLRRQQAITLGLANIAAFVARRSADRRRDIMAYRVMLARRILAEFGKDLLSRRFDLPQLRGALAAIGHSAAIFAHPGPGFEAWYADRQRRILGLPPEHSPVPQATAAAPDPIRPSQP